jgi:hypothetical protein
MKIEEEIQCVEREISMRKALYPRWVKAEKMSQAKMDHEIETMEDVLQRLKDIRALQTLIQ